MGRAAVGGGVVERETRLVHAQRLSVATAAAPLPSVEAVMVGSGREVVPSRSVRLRLPSFL